MSTNGGSDWIVGCIDGATGTLALINTIGSTDPSIIFQQCTTFLNNFSGNICNLTGIYYMTFYLFKQRSAVLCSLLGELKMFTP